MKKEAILHIPMSEYAHGLDEKRIVLRLRAARGDLERVTLWYGDTACRRTPIDWFPEPMERILSDEYHDWWELTLECPYHRIFYHFELSDGRETCFYYGGGVTAAARGSLLSSRKVAADSFGGRERSASTRQREAFRK